MTKHTKIVGYGGSAVSIIRRKNGTIRERRVSREAFTESGVSLMITEQQEFFDEQGNPVASEREAWSDEGWKRLQRKIKRDRLLKLFSVKRLKFKVNRLLRG